MLEKGQPQRFNAYNSPHEDLREFIKRAEEAGEIVRIKGADPHLEMGTLGEIVNHARPEPPALLFEDVPGYPKGMRLISGATNSSKRLAITLGPAGAVLPARRGAVLSRAHEAAQADPAQDRAAPARCSRTSTATTTVDLFKFPVPFLHEKDGGRYIGTDDLVIMRDPDGGWVNAATYRGMVHDKNHVCDLDLARQAGPADPREVLRDGQALPGADLLRARSAAVPRRRQ